MIEWLEILAAVVGAVGVLCALVLGYRAPRNAEPWFEIQFEDEVMETDTLRAALLAHNPSDRPVLLRSLVIQNHERGVFFLSDAPSRSRSSTYESSEISDVLAIDLEVPPEQSSKVDFYVGREPRSSARELVADIEYSSVHTPSAVRSATLRARFPQGEPQRRRLRTAAASPEASPS